MSDLFENRVPSDANTGNAAVRTEPELTVFTRYGTLGASSRCRYYLYEQPLRRAGMNLRIHNFLDNRYLSRLYRGQSIAFGEVAKAYLRRIYTASRASSRILMEYELFPYLPYWLDRLFLKGRKYVINLDDNVWTKYHHKPLLRGKYDRLIKNANGVVVANDFLLNKVRPLNPAVIKIPTVVDLAKYHCDKPKFDRFTIVWIGTPVTYRYLLLHAEVFQALAAAFDFELLVLARSELAKQIIPRVQMRFVDWSEACEVEMLTRSHVGIMPLSKDEFSQGKSAFKIIQYLAAGLPVVASPVGENCRIIAHNTNGMLADSKEEWLSAFDCLRQPEAYNRFAKSAKASAYDYSLQKYFPVMLDFIRTSLDSAYSP